MTRVYPRNTDHTHALCCASVQCTTLQLVMCYYCVVNSKGVDPMTDNRKYLKIMAKRTALSYIRYINIPKRVCSLFVLTMNPLNALANLLVD